MQTLKARQNTVASEAFKAPVRRMRRERPRGLHRETYPNLYSCPAEAAVAQAQSWCRALAKPGAEAKNQSPVQVTARRYLAHPALRSRFRQFARHALGPFSCQFVRRAKPAEAQRPQTLRATDRSASWPRCFPLILAADE